MAAHKRERKQAAVKGGGTGFHVEREMDSRWNWGSLSSFYVVLVLRCPRLPLGRWNGFTLIGFTLGLGYGFTLEEWDAFRVGRGYVKRVLRC